MAITLSAVVSRTSGVAPLAVFVDCTATTADGVTHPFHELFYEHSFGDTDAGLWTYGANAGNASKNYDTGPCAAHVYETPGTYTITSRVCDGSTWATTTNTIVVDNPDVVFATTNTICIGATGVPSAGECPAGATRVQQSNFATILSTYCNTGTGKRILLKRGDSFTCGTNQTILDNGPGIIGTFGTGAKPLITDNSADGVRLIAFNTQGNTDYSWGDWRIMDLSMNGATRANCSAIGLDNAGVMQALLLRIDGAEFNTSFNIAGDGPNWTNNQLSMSHVVDQIAIVECTTINGNNTAYSSYNSGNRVAFLGNHFDNGGIINRYDYNSVSLGNGTHVLRFPYLNKAIISHNDIIRPGFDRHCIKLHAPFWNAGVPDQTAGNWSNYSSSINGDGYTKYVVISDNYILGGQGGWECAISPQNSGEDERVTNTIIEKNRSVGNGYTQAAFRICARYVTARNNLFLANGSSNDSAFARIDIDGIEPYADSVWIYNNTMCKPAGTIGGSDGFSIVTMPDARITNVTVRNNLGYAPTLTGSVPIFDAGITGLTQSGNSTSSQINNTSPLFQNLGGLNLVDYRVGSGSYAVNGGVNVNITTELDSFNCKDLTTTNHRIGAFVPRANALGRGSK